MCIPLSSNQGKDKEFLEISALNVTTNLSPPNTWQQLFTMCQCSKCLPKT